ncbi:MAG: phosphomannomutase/phosphoglucomutase, partial [Bacteroidales bacterium]|nr:phosphomannomutase/phosphoglucomutase [Bacteroidales bacterium]
MEAFKAYDIRGVYGRDFQKGDVYKIGFFLSELLNTKQILVGRDVRLSSPEIYAYLCQGIQDSGADVCDLGICTTPMVYWATAKYDFKASVMITASHNPKEYNGLKISREKALPVGYDNGLNELERWLNERVVQPKPQAAKGRVLPFDQKAAYLAFQRQWLSDFSKLKVVMDCSNGMASLFVRELYGDRPVYLYDELDGSFPNHEANPLEAVNREDLQATVLETGADLGVIFDGDADRVMFVDERGQFISPDLMIAVLGYYFLEEKGLHGKVLQDIRTSKSVRRRIEALGGTMEMWRVGRAYAAAKLREIDGVFGGELAGHYYFRDFYYSDSGLMACSLILGILSRFKAEGKSVSALIADIAVYVGSGEINYRIERKPEAMEALKAAFTAEETP